MSDSNHIDQKLFERIEAYLDERMDPDEQLAFEVKIKAKPQLEQEVELERTLRNAVEAGAMRDRIEGLHEQLFSEDEQTSLNTGMSPWKIAAGIAIILGIGALLYTSSASEDTLFAEYATVDPGLPVPMSASDSYDFHDAMVDYKSGDYGRAIATWSRLYSLDENNDTLKYYLGSAHFNNAAFEQAIPYFGSVSVMMGSNFRDKALWYLGLSYLQLDRKDDFKALIPSETSVYRSRFEEIKKRLKE
jgi:tetratricopeptide (TPR) repeat protein